VNCYAKLGGVLLAGTRGGIFASTNDGASWYESHSGLNTNEVFAFLVDTDTLYAATNLGVYRSTDDGASWSLKSFGTTYVTIRDLIRNGGWLYAGSRGGGVYASSDGGASWTERNSGLGNHIVNALASIDSHLFAGTWGGVCVSTNGGSAWSPASVGLTDSLITSFLVRGTELFAGAFPGGVFQSTDLGQNWARSTTDSRTLTSLTWLP
jgi:photosystem II stability/assembly factor-like uncharacterized protein